MSYNHRSILTALVQVLSISDFGLHGVCLLHGRLEFQLQLRGPAHQPQRGVEVVLHIRKGEDGMG